MRAKRWELPDGVVGADRAVVGEKAAPVSVSGPEAVR